MTRPTETPEQVRISRGLGTGTEPTTPESQISPDDLATTNDADLLTIRWEFV